MTRLRASAAHQVNLCPGSPRASWGLPDTKNEDSNRGDRIHKFMASLFSSEFPPPEDITEEEMDTAIKLRDKIMPFFPSPGERGELYIEVEVHLVHEFLSGHIDLHVWNDDGEHLIADWKTGWGDVAPAVVNAQVRAYSCLAAAHYPYSEIRATLVTPRGVDTPVIYGPDSIHQAWEELRTIHNRSLSPEAKRYPSPDACKYCKAYGVPTCPETCKMLEVLPEEIPSLPAMPVDELSRLARLWKLAEKRGKQVLDEVRSRIESGESVPHCTLGADTFTKEVTDIIVAKALLPEIDRDRFLGACAISLTKLSEVYADVRKIPKAQAKREVEAQLESIIKLKPRRGSLRVT